MDRVLPYIAGDSFAFKAKKPGRILSITEDVAAIIEYDDKTRDVIDLSPKQSKNTNTGYWITNKLDMNADMKVGSRFTADTLLAYNHKFFKSDTLRGGFQHMPGRLARVGIGSGPFTYEDSSLVSQRFAEEMETEITMEKVIDLPPTVNITQIVKLGDKIRAGDPVITFEESTTQATAAFLRSLGDSADELSELSQNQVLSKVSGTIVGLKIIYTEKFDTLTPSLQKAILESEAPRKRYNDVLRQNFDLGFVKGEELPSVPVDEPLEESVLAINQLSLDLYNEVVPPDATPTLMRREYDPAASYACVMAPVPVDIAAQNLEWLNTVIDPADLAVKGIEDDSHVTILYGLAETDPSPLFKAVIARMAPIDVTLGELKCFSNEKYDVLVVEIVDSEHASRLRGWIRLVSPHTTTFPKYKPHMTLAYLKPGTASKYLGKYEHPLKGSQLRIGEITHAFRGREPYRFELNGDVDTFPPLIDTDDVVTEAVIPTTEAVPLPDLPDSANIQYSGYIPKGVKVAKGRDLRGVRISFMVNFPHHIGVGDKIAFYAALKSVVCEVAERGEEPFYIDKKGNKVIVDAVTSPFGILNRKTTDVLSMLALGTILVEMKRQISDVATEEGFEHRLGII